VSAKYAGAGHTPLRDLLRRTFVIGSHDVAYPADASDLNCAAAMPAHPSSAATRLNEATVNVFSQATVTCHLCFAVAANDAQSLALFVQPPRCDVTACARHVWFALRRTRHVRVP